VAILDALEMALSCQWCLEAYKLIAAALATFNEPKPPDAPTLAH